MTSLGGIGGGNNLAWLEKKLFQQIDTSGTGAIDKTSLEKAVTSSGGTAASADSLFAQLDPNNTGSVTEQQFEQNFPTGTLSGQMGAQLLSYQANGWPGQGGKGDGAGRLAQALFSRIDTAGTGTITKSSLEAAVTGAGGTATAADALYAKLDPNNTGSVTEQQLAALLQKSDGHHEHRGGGHSGGPVDALASLLEASGNAGSKASEADLAQSLFTQIDTAGSGAITKSSLEQAVAAAGGTTASADALYAKLDPNNTGSVSEQQFAQVITQPGPAGGSGNADGDADDGPTTSAAANAVAGTSAPSSDSSTTAEAALQALIAALTGGSGTATSTQAAAGDALSTLLRAAGLGPSGEAQAPAGTGFDLLSAISAYEANSSAAAAA